MLLNVLRSPPLTKTLTDKRSGYSLSGEAEGPNNQEENGEQMQGYTKYRSNQEEGGAKSQPQVKQINANEAESNC